MLSLGRGELQGSLLKDIQACGSSQKGHALRRQVLTDKVTTRNECCIAL